MNNEHLLQRGVPAVGNFSRQINIGVNQCSHRSSDVFPAERCANGGSLLAFPQGSRRTLREASYRLFSVVRFNKFRLM
ncbi:MAG: hypothetical protein KME40_06755 [Komarekiella atlantica HA4396-MV6]|nr:hypothetical protein [Komarekiella atlantica HA4396-MV6]